MSFYFKDPRSRVDYGIAWPSAFLDGQAIGSSLWSVKPAEAGGIVVEAHEFDAAATSATLSGGIEGHVYSVTNLVALPDGREDSRSITLRVEER